MSVPAPAWKLDGISPRAYQHPLDRAATAALQRIPYLDDVVRKLIALGYERAYRAFALGASVKLGEDQLPETWVLQREVYNTLDLAPVPDLYLGQAPVANAMTIGSDRPIVLVNSELYRILPPSGHRVVLAHEAAHVHSDHVLYQTALAILLRIAASNVRLPLLAGLPLLAIELALLEWSRGAELSCDRGAALVTRDPQEVCRTLMVIAAGEAAERLSLDAFIAQAMEYDAGGGLERITRLLQDLQLTHPMPVRRVRELLEWVRSGEYDRIVGGEYVRRGEEPPLREEAEAAQEHYAKRISDAIGQAGTSIADVGQQLGDWLNRQRRNDAGSDPDD